MIGYEVKISFQPSDFPFGAIKIDPCWLIYWLHYLNYLINKKASSIIFELAFLISA
jgi:hypothetical protein